MIEFVSGLVGSVFALVGCILLLGPIALIIYLVVLGGRRKRDRLEDLERFAARMGLDFDPNNDYDHDERYTQFEIFGFGSDRYAYNTMSGELELGGRSTSIVMGDFHYETKSGTGKKRSTHTHRISYVILRLPWDRIPELIVRPENIFDRLVGFLGFDDIDFESAEFSKRFMVRSKDRKFAYDLIDPRMMEYMLASDPPVFDLEHGSICMTRGVCFQNSSGFDAVLRWADGFLERWPDHVVKDIESRAT